jgi:hypothetical protein
MENETKKEERSPLEKKQGKDRAICRILKTKELRYHIGMTDKMQSFDLQFKDDNYTFFLDATPFDDGTEEGKEKNESLKRIYNLI